MHSGKRELDALIGQFLVQFEQLLNPGCINVVDGFGTNQNLLNWRVGLRNVLPQLSHKIGGICEDQLSIKAEDQQTGNGFYVRVEAGVEIEIFSGLFSRAQPYRGNFLVESPGSKTESHPGTTHPERRSRTVGTLRSGCDATSAHIRV